MGFFAAAAPAIAGGVLGALGGSQKSRSSKSASPWGPIQPYMRGAARTAYDELVRGENPAIAGILAQAQGPQPIVDLATQQLTDTLGGGYLENPYTSEAVQAAIRPAQEAYLTSTLPGILGRGSARGRLSSGNTERRIASANDSLSRALTDTAGRIGFQNYSDERGRMMGALGMAPSIQALGYQPLEMQRAAYNDQGDQALRVLAALQGVPGGTTTSSSGGGLSGALAGALGGGAAAYGMYDLFNRGRRTNVGPSGIP